MTAIAAPPPRSPREDLGWSVVVALLGPLADRHPDVALSVLGCADEAVATARAGARARWRRHGPWPARP